MLEIISLSIIIVFVLLAGPAFRKRYKQNSLTNCLAMLVIMTMSTSIGILFAHWLPDIVLATIASILASTLLAMIMMYKLPLKMIIDNFGMLFMGAMMGVMFELMTSNYSTLSLLFFMMLFIASVIVALGLWNRTEYPSFRKAIPFNVTIISILSVFIIGLSGVATAFPHQAEADTTTNNHHEHTHK